MLVHPAVVEAEQHTLTRTRVGVVLRNAPSCGLNAVLDREEKPCHALSSGARECRVLPDPDADMLVSKRERIEQAITLGSRVVCWRRSGIPGLP